MIGAINDLVIYILLPCLSIYCSLKFGQVNFHCHRKDKSGLNLQATCDHCLRFIWVEKHLRPNHLGLLPEVGSSEVAVVELKTIIITIRDDELAFVLLLVPLIRDFINSLSVPLAIFPLPLAVQPMCP